MTKRQIYFPKPLLRKNQLNKFDGLKIVHYGNGNKGTIRGEMEQVGTNLMVHVDWEEAGTTVEWITNLLSLNPKINLQQWRQQLISRM